MEELKKVLEGRPVLYLATVEGYLPRVRPINHYICLLYTSDAADD